MSNEELVVKYQQSRSGKVFQELLDSNEGLIMKLVHSFTKNPSDFDDFKQESLIAFERSARLFDPARLGKFSTFAVHCMKNQLILFKNKFFPPEVVFVPLDSSDFVTKPARMGIGQDLDYALSKIPNWQRQRVMKHYFSNKDCNRSDRTISRYGTAAMKKYL